MADGLAELQGGIKQRRYVEDHFIFGNLQAGDPGRGDQRGWHVQLIAPPR
jgi:hypothetical protein